MESSKEFLQNFRSNLFVDFSKAFDSIHRGNTSNLCDTHTHTHTHTHIYIYIYVCVCMCVCVCVCVCACVCVCVCVSFLQIFGLLLFFYVSLKTQHKIINFFKRNVLLIYAKFYSIFSFKWLLKIRLNWYITFCLYIFL